MNLFESNVNKQTHLQFKVVLLGDSGVGKTALIRRYCFNEFAIDTQSTIGLQFHSITLRAEHKGVQFEIGLSIWDFGGQERFRSLLPQFILGANASLLVFDLMNGQALKNLKEWYQLLKINAGNVPFDLIGTKADLIEKYPESCVDNKDIYQTQEELGALHYLETSAKCAKNTVKLFPQLIQEVVDQAYPEYQIQIL